MLHGIIVYRCHVVYVWHGEGDDVVVVRVVDVDAPDLDLTSVKKEFAGFWKRKTNSECKILINSRTEQWQEKKMQIK